MRFIGNPVFLTGFENEMKNEMMKSDVEQEIDIEVIDEQHLYNDLVRSQREIEQQTKDNSISADSK